MPNISNKSMKKFAKTLLDASYAPPKAKITEGRMIEFAFLNAPGGCVIQNDKIIFRKHVDAVICGMRVRSEPSGEVLPIAFTFNLKKYTCKLYFDSTRTDMTSKWNEFLQAEAIKVATCDRESGIGD